MANYLNPASFQSKNDFVASGMLGGALAAHRDDQADAMVDQQMKEGELDRQLKEIKVKEDAGLLDSKLAKAAYDEAKAKFDKGEYDNGNVRTMTDSHNATTLSDQSLKRTQDDVGQKTAAAPLWTQMAEELKARGGKVDWANQDDRDWYNDWRGKMQQYAPNMPSFPGAADTQKIMMQGEQASRFTQMKGASANVKHSQAMEAAAVGPTITGQAHVTASAATNAANERIQAAHDDQRAEAVQAKADAAKVADSHQKLLNMTVDRINKKPNGVNTGDTEEVAHNRAIAEQWAEFSAETELSKNPAFPIMQIQAKTNPQAAAQVKSLVDEKKSDLLKGVKGYYGDSKATQTVTPSAPTKDTGPESQAKSAFGSYEPDKYEYGINPKTGKFARKPK